MPANKRPAPAAPQADAPKTKVRRKFKEDFTKWQQHVTEELRTLLHEDRILDIHALLNTYGITFDSASDPRSYTLMLTKQVGPFFTAMVLLTTLAHEDVCEYLEGEFRLAYHIYERNGIQVFHNIHRKLYEWMQKCGFDKDSDSPALARFYHTVIAPIAHHVEDLYDYDDEGEKLVPDTRAMTAFDCPLIESVRSQQMEDKKLNINAMSKELCVYLREELQTRDLPEILGMKPAKTQK